MEAVRNSVTAVYFNETRGAVSLTAVVVIPAVVRT
jgi:hypothetical protein